MKQKFNDKNVQTFLGMPMRWDSKNIFKNLWNKQDDRIFPPKYFGIGWSLNLHALLQTAGIIAGKKSKKP